MTFTSDLLETPPTLSSASKWIAMNGYVYLSLGAWLFIIWPGAVQNGLSGMQPLCWCHEVRSFACSA